MDIVSENTEMLGLRFNTGQRIAYRPAGQAAVKIDKETVLPFFSRDGTGFNAVHIQAVKNKMGQDIVQRTACMRQLKAYADLIGLF